MLFFSIYILKRALTIESVKLTIGLIHTVVGCSLMWRLLREKNWHVKLAVGSIHAVWWQSVQRR